MNVYQSLLEKKKSGQKSFTVLLDPDKITSSSLAALVGLANRSKVDYFFVGGSLVVSDHLDECIAQIKKESSIPVILFPGSPSQLSRHADALLYLSLISGRNPELLIGNYFYRLHGN
jgi:putative glycerol-1-phosphate prenyltransferase